MKTRKGISKKAKERYRRDATEHKQGEEAPRESKETARRLSQENATIAEIGQIISSTLNIEEVYERFAEEVKKLIPFDRIVINTINVEKDTVINLYMAGKGIVGRQIGEVYPLEGSANAEMVHKKSTILIQTEDFNEYKNHFPMLLSTFQAGFRSIMNVPLFSKGQLIGGLLLRSFKPYAYTDEDVRLAERVSHQIAGAIANAQLFMERMRAEEALQRSEEDAKRLAQENAVMAKIGQIISSTLDIEEVYERFGEEVRKLIFFDRISINILNHEEETATIAYIAGIYVADRRTGDVIPLVGTSTGEVYRTRSSLLIQEEDLQGITSRFPGLSSTFRAGLLSTISVPLISKDQVIGILHIQSLKPNAYTELDLKLAERVGNQIAGAIANAQLFMERMRAEKALKKSEEELRAFNEELRATEEELRATNEELQAANEELKETQEQLIRSEKLAAIGKLAGGVGHELRNPLGAIKNAVYYIKGKLINSELAKGEPRIIEFLGIMDDEISSSNKIINDLLNFSRVAKPTVSPVRIRKVMEDVLSRLTVPENIEVINKVDADLPEVEIDADQVRQVFVNIATNAIQAMPERGKLTIDARKGDKFLEVAISDTGVGISEDVIGKIFDPLFTTRAKGIGLGLAVCKSIIERHGGAIGVESNVGEGTTFTVKLPLKAN
jgi:signal transduction histidine kinase